nr:uncharacterized protein LOC112204120 [Pan troglodytes]
MSQVRKPKLEDEEQPGCFMVDLLHAYMMVPWIALVCASPVPDTSCGSPRRRAARREHGARNRRARLAGGTLSSRRTRPGPLGYGAVAAAGARAGPRADPRKELKAAGDRVAASVGAVKEDGHGDSSVVRVVGAGHQRELLRAWLPGATACGPLACLTVVGGGGDRDCSTTRVAFLALPAQLLHARRRRRHLEPATPRLASLQEGGIDGDCSAPERPHITQPTSRDPPSQETDKLRPRKAKSPARIIHLSSKAKYSRPWGVPEDLMNCSGHIRRLQVDQNSPTQQESSLEPAT